MRLSGIGQSVRINDLCKANVKANWPKPEGVNQPKPQWDGQRYGETERRDHVHTRRQTEQIDNPADDGCMRRI